MQQPAARRPRQLLLAFLCTVAAGCGNAGAPAYERPTATVVTVATAQIRELRDVANAPGVIVPAAVADLTVYAPEMAEIVDLPVQADQPVEAGDVLVQFDIASLNQELAAAELGEIEAQARLDRARTELSRQTDLFERGITSRMAHDAARLEHSAAETALTLARNRLEAVRAGQDRAVVRAPFSGVVVAVWHQKGDIVRPDRSDPILRLIDPTRVQVAVQLPVAQLARVLPGQAATVRAIAGLEDEPAVVASKTEALDPTAPTGEVRLSFTNPATLPLDTPVSVEILLDRRADALVIPLQAVNRDVSGPYVMVAGPDGLAQRREVRLGLATSDLVEVVTGLEPGEQVIVAGLQDVEPGMPIAIGR